MSPVPWLLLIFKLIPGDCTQPGDMSQVHLRVSAINELPVLAVIRDPNNSSVVRFAGPTKNLFDWLSARLNCSYSFVLVPETLVEEKGGSSAALEFMMMKRVDMISSYLVMTPDRYAVADFTSPMMFSGYALGQPMPELDSRLFASLKPFDPLVWLVIATSMAIVALTFVCLPRQEENRRGLSTFGTNLYRTLSILVGQGENMMITKLSFRLVAAGWCLTAIVLVNVYNGMLVSFLTVPRYKPIVNSLEELVRDSRLQISTAKQSLIAQTILDADSPVLKSLGDSLRQHPNHMTANDAAALQLLASGCCAHLAPEMLVAAYVKRTVTGGGECRLTSSKSVGFDRAFTHLLAKDFKYNNLITQRLMELFESGLVAHWTDLGLKDNNCLKRRIDRPKNSRISLLSLSGAFIILGVGMAVSCLAFLLEHVWQRCHSKYRN